MRERLNVFLEDVRSSFWFVPTIMAVAAAGLSVATIDLDRVTNAAFANSIGFIWSGGAQGARSILSTIAGSMITVAGVVFSITIVALTLASSQFGPRLLRNFVRDRGNQITLGTFISTFMYCVLVLRTVRVRDEGDFVPFISVTCGVALAVASIGVLIYFIHHVSRSIQAEFLIAKVGAEFRLSIEEHFPEEASDRPSAEAVAAFFSKTTVVPLVQVVSTKGGYLQGFDRKGLLNYAFIHDARVELLVAPGDFILHDGIIARVWIADTADLKRVQQKIIPFFKIGNQRTESQDVRYGGRQLSEIAARSLSPGINDPYTAMGCIDWGVDALSSVARRTVAPCFAEDERGNVRMKEVPSDFASIFSVMMEPIISYGMGSVIVTQHLIESLRRMVRYLERPEDIYTLQQFGQRIEVQSHRLLEDEIALAVVKDAVGLLQHDLAGRSSEIASK